MDRRIRIHFFPRDPSHARMISLPRKVGIALFFTSIPLCLIGDRKSTRLNSSH